MARVTLKKREESVEIEQLDGSVLTYFVQEMSGPESEEYLETMKDKIDITSDGKIIGVKSYLGIHTALLSRCLKDRDRSPVSEDTINSFPSTAQKDLFEIAQRVNGLSKEGIEAVKKE